jgi:acetate kinase
MKALIINVGSTSLKYKLYEMPQERIVAAGRLEGIGQPKSEFRFTGEGAEPVQGSAEFPTYAAGVEHLLAHLLDGAHPAIGSLDEVEAVGFKTVLARGVVDAVVLDEKVLAAMEEFTYLAPSHNPPYIAAIRDFQSRLPHTPMIGLFEPAFHKTIPEHAWRYALPYDWPERFGIRRYGFHGASHRYAAERATQMLGREDLRLITCHLGGSSSINATRGTTSLDNSFGLSPQSGLIQSNRPGDIDAFIPLYLIDQKGMSAAEVRRLFSAESGLKGMSGVSGEMKDVLAAAEQGNARAQLTLDAFVYGVRKWIGAAAVILGGVDALVFTGGIGERSASLREACCRDLDFMGIRLDASKNSNLKPDADVASHDSAARILLIEANEELIVARACAEVLSRL